MTNKPAKPSIKKDKNKELELERKKHREIVTSIDYEKFDATRNLLSVPHTEYNIIDDKIHLVCHANDAKQYFYMEDVMHLTAFINNAEHLKEYKAPSTLEKIVYSGRIPEEKMLETLNLRNVKTELNASDLNFREILSVFDKVALPPRMLDMEKPLNLYYLQGISSDKIRVPGEGRLTSSEEVKVFDYWHYGLFHFAKELMYESQDGAIPEYAIKGGKFGVVDLRGIKSINNIGNIFYKTEIDKLIVSTSFINIASSANITISYNCEINTLQIIEDEPINPCSEVYKFISCKIKTLKLIGENIPGYLLYRCAIGGPIEVNTKENLKEYAIQTVPTLQKISKNSFNDCGLNSFNLIAKECDTFAIIPHYLKCPSYIYTDNYKELNRLYESFNSNSLHRICVLPYASQWNKAEPIYIDLITALVELEKKIDHTMIRNQK